MYQRLTIEFLGNFKGKTVTQGGFEKKKQSIFHTFYFNLLIFLSLFQSIYLLFRDTPP
jgi:hypothetical protein